MPVVAEVAASLLFRQIPVSDTVFRREDQSESTFSFHLQWRCKCSNRPKGWSQRKKIKCACTLFVAGHKISVQSTFAEHLNISGVCQQMEVALLPERVTILFLYSHIHSYFST